MPPANLLRTGRHRRLRVGTAAMRRSWRRAAFTCRLVLWALCFGALAPAVSQWLAQQRAASTFEVCAQSTHDRPAGTAAHPFDDAHGDGSCGYCTLAQHVPVLPPDARSQAVPAVPPVAALPVPPRQAPRATTPRYARAARAPPKLV